MSSLAGGIVPADPPVAAGNLPAHHPASSWISMRLSTVEGAHADFTCKNCEVVVMRPRKGQAATAEE